MVMIARVVPEISSRTDTQTHTLTYSLQFFETASVGKENIWAMQHDKIMIQEASSMQ